MAKRSDLRQFFSLSELGVRQSDTISGALGQWSTDDKIAVAVPDHTRPLNVRAVLEELIPRIHGEYKVIVGLGLHRRMSSEELSTIQQFSPVQHDPFDCLPLTIEREQFGVYREIVEADWSISIGIAELHQYAGVSGGYKGVIVGCGSADVIASLHRRESVCAAGVCIGQVEGNPFRERIDRMGRASNCRVALVYVPAVKQWIFGLPDDVIVRAAQLIKPWHWVARPAAGAVLRVPTAKAGSLYQASRAATYLALSPHPAVHRGGKLILEASLPEGLGSEAGFVRALQRYRPPWLEVLTGERPTGAGAQRIIMLALLAQNYKLSIRGCRDPEVFQAIGIEASAEPAEVPDGWLDVTDPFTCIPQWRG